MSVAQSKEASFHLPLSYVFWDLVLIVSAPTSSVPKTYRVDGSPLSTAHHLLLLHSLLVTISHFFFPRASLYLEKLCKLREETPSGYISQTLWERSIWVVGSSRLQEFKTFLSNMNHKWLKNSVAIQITGQVTYDRGTQDQLSEEWFRQCALGFLKRIHHQGSVCLNWCCKLGDDIYKFSKIYVDLAQ